MSNDAGKSYKFNIQNGVITGVFEVKNGYIKAKQIDGNGTWTVQGNRIVKIENDHGNIETTIYTDQDGDGFYVKGSELHTLSGAHVETSSESHEDSDDYPDTSNSNHDLASKGSHDDDGNAHREHGITSAGTASGGRDEDEDVSDGHDGYEYHRTTENDHELHGSDMHDSVLIGAHNDDLLVGGAHDDILDGADGDDTLEGGGGDDILMGGGQDGHDRNHLDGGSGDDILVAGGTKTRSMDDFFKTNLAVVDAVTTNAKYASLAALALGSVDDDGNGVENIFQMRSGNGNDLIFNFHATTDKLQIEREINGSGIHDIETLVQHVTVDGNNVMIDFGGGNSVTLVGVDVSNLTSTNIDWV